MAASSVSSLDLFALDWKVVWSGADTSEPVGAVFTKPEIVRLILDLVGYTCDRPLLDHRLLEPSCGDGAFLIEVAERLVQSIGDDVLQLPWDDLRLDCAIRAVDISSANVASAQALLASWLIAKGCPAERASALTLAWIVQADFLLADFNSGFDFVVGNPPYVRLEHLPKRVLETYRARFETSRDRADLYVAFFEQGLRLLSRDGVLGFICANRFAKNAYGKNLRSHIAQHYHVRHYVNLEHTQPFAGDVSAYPAIFTIDRAKGSSTRSATIDDLEQSTLERLRTEMLGNASSSTIVSTFAAWYPNGAPWISTSTSDHFKLEALAERYPTLEESAPGTKIGIGVATGADQVYVLPKFDESIEVGRQIPLAMSAGISGDQVKWKGHYLLNPFADEDTGALASLKDFPGFAAYLELHGDALRSRHVGKRNPDSWYRTIDRIWPQLQHRPKLLIPDIQSGGVVGFDDGKYYPHHNLYWITSDTWPLRALQAILRSDFVTQQVRAHSVQMRGGSLRYQAQTLRKIRIPLLSTLESDALRTLEHAAFGSSSLNDLVCDMNLSTVP